jgi:hypothetical protein
VARGSQTSPLRAQWKLVDLRARRQSRSRTVCDGRREPSLGGIGALTRNAPQRCSADTPRAERARETVRAKLHGRPAHLYGDAYILFAVFRGRSENREVVRGVAEVLPQDIAAGIVFFPGSEGDARHEHATTVDRERSRKHRRSFRQYAQFTKSKDPTSAFGGSCS